MAELKYAEPVSHYIKTQGALQQLANQKQQSELAERGMSLQEQGFEQNKKLQDVELEGRQQAQGRQALADMGKSAIWADTPEKWEQALDTYEQIGMDVKAFRGRFDLRPVVAGLATQNQEAALKKINQHVGAAQQLRGPDDEPLVGALVTDPITGKSRVSVADLPPGVKIERESSVEKEARKIREVKGKEAIKGSVKRLQTTVNEAVTNAKGIGVIKRSLRLLDEVKTGGIDAVALKAKQVFGVEGADEAELSANLGKAVLSQLRPVFGAQFTEREGVRLERIEAGFGKSTEGNKRLLKQLQKIIEREATRGIDAALELEDYQAAQDIKNLMAFDLDEDQSEEFTSTGGIKFKRVK